MHDYSVTASGRCDVGYGVEVPHLATHDHPLSNAGFCFTGGTLDSCQKKRLPSVGPLVDRRLLPLKIDEELRRRRAGHTVTPISFQIAACWQSSIAREAVRLNRS